MLMITNAPHRSPKSSPELLSDCSNSSKRPSPELTSASSRDYHTSMNELRLRLSILTTTRRSASPEGHKDFTHNSEALLRRQLRDSQQFVEASPVQQSFSSTVSWALQESNESVKRTTPIHELSSAQDSKDDSRSPLLRLDELFLPPIPDTENRAIIDSSLVGPLLHRQSQPVSPTPLANTESRGAVFELEAKSVANNHVLFRQPPTPNELDAVRVSLPPVSDNDWHFHGCRISGSRSQLQNPPHELFSPTHPPNLHGLKSLETKLPVSTTRPPVDQIPHSLRPVPYCSAAHRLQQDPTRLKWQLDFTWTHDSPHMLCKTSKSRIPRQSIKIRCMPSTWQASERFIARCHKPSVSIGGPARLGCVICPAESLLFRSRNELRAHLETHSAAVFKDDPDVVECVG